MVRWRAVLSTALAVMLGAATLTACTNDPTPSDVKVAWADDTRQAVRVSWKDSGAPNRITIEGVLSTNPSYVQYVGEKAANSWDIPASTFPPDGTYKVAVGVGTSTGGLTSQLVRSDVFDTDGPVRPGSATATPTGNDVLMRWDAPARPQDFTPGDPLDVTGNTQQYVPVVGRPGEPMRPAGPATTSKRLVIKNLAPPYLFQLRAQNEWTSTVGGQISARLSEATAAIPTLAQYGRTLTIRGRVVLQEVTCPAEGRCVQQRATASGLPVTLMTQVLPRGRWTPAALGKTTPGGHFQVAVVNTATRPYRIDLPLYTKVGMMAAATSSKVQLTRSVIRVQTAGFVGGGSKKRNENATALIVLQPAMRTTAMLQVRQRGTSRWLNARAVAIVNGAGSYTFKAAALGVWNYRFVLPQATMLGRPLYPVITQNMTLSVRP